MSTQCGYSFGQKKHTPGSSLWWLFSIMSFGKQRIPGEVDRVNVQREKQSEVRIQGFELKFSEF